MKSRIGRSFWRIFHIVLLVSLTFFGPLAEGSETILTKSRGIFDLTANYSETVKSENFAQKKHFWRAFIETSIFLGIAQIRYKKTHTKWIEGVYKYRATWKDQKEKFFNWKNWNYDANCFTFNWTHALSGSIYYNFSRTNNLSVLESLLMSWASSSYWEFIVEYRSDISINDHIITPLGGLPAGEAWFQLGKYFSDRSDKLSQILSFLNPILKVNRYFDRQRIKNMPSASSPGWHKFNIDLGLRNTRIQKLDYNQSSLYAGLHTQIINIPEYGQQGSENRFVEKTVFSEIQMDVTGIGKKAEEYNLSSRVVWFGLFNQNIDSLNRGYSLYLGGGSAYSMFKKKSGTTTFPCSFKGRNPEDLKLDEPRDFTDKLAIVHIFGPVLDWTKFGKSLNIRLILDMYLDFAIANSYAFNTYSQQYDFSGVKTPLLINGYYYGWGTTLSSGLNISWKNLSVQTYMRYQSYGSIDGKDRYQHLLTNDFHITDSRFLSRFTVGYKIPGLPLTAKVSYEGIFRKGGIEDIEEKQWEVRGFLGLSLVY
ncbi:DUF3943 domain-containing protein [Acidobacteriota bacterium]